MRGLGGNGTPLLRWERGRMMRGCWGVGCRRRRLGWSLGLRMDGRALVGWRTAIYLRRRESGRRERVLPAKVGIVGMAEGC